MTEHRLLGQRPNVAVLTLPLAIAGFLIALAVQQPPIRFVSAGVTSGTLLEHEENGDDDLPRMIRGECLHAHRNILDVDANGRVWRLHLTSSTEVTLDGKPAAPDVLEAGQSIEAEVEVERNVDDSGRRLAAQRVEARSRMNDEHHGQAGAGPPTRG